MRRYLLDTNIISNVTKPAPSASLVAWMAEQANACIVVTDNERDFSDVECINPLRDSTR